MGARVISGSPWTPRIQEYQFYLDSGNSAPRIQVHFLIQFQIPSRDQARTHIEPKLKLDSGPPKPEMSCVRSCLLMSALCSLNLDRLQFRCEVNQTRLEFLRFKSTVKLKPTSTCSYSKASYSNPNGANFNPSSSNWNWDCESEYYPVCVP